MHLIGRRPWFAAAAASCLLALSSVASPARAASADDQFKALTQRFISEYGMYSPVGATQLGDHVHDADLDDMSDAGRARALAWVRELQGALGSIDRTKLSRANQVDAAVLDNQLRYSVWTEEKFRNWSWDPLVYTGLTGNALYSLLAREYAPWPQRLRAVTSRLEALPRLYEQTRANLVPARVPSINAETAVKQNPGVLSLIDELVVPHLDSLPADDRARLERAIAAAKSAVETHQKWLDTELVLNAKGEFRIGAALYDEELSYALMSPLTRTEIRRRADAAVVETRSQMYATAREVLAGRAGAPATPDTPTADQQQAAIRAALELAYADRPARDEVLPAARRALEETTAFVRAKSLVTLPTEPLDIIVMPEFQRGVAVAYCDPPGPLDKGQHTFYAISPIPNDWTDQQVTSFLREYNTRSIADVTIHEAMPGHYLQLAHANQYPSVLRAMLYSSPFVEGWAVYTERMMADQGFRGDDPLMRLIQLKWYLRAATNAIIDSAIHVDGMTRDEAMKLMTETGFQEEREAASKWVRAQLTSAQLSTYFVGYQEHADLRRDGEARAGKSFDLHAWHDKVLSFGSPPVRFVRELLFDEPIK
jgi:uncharacterized protein (DUF885 family)